MPTLRDRLGPLLADSPTALAIAFQRAQQQRHTETMQFILDNYRGWFNIETVRVMETRLRQAREQDLRERVSLQNTIWTQTSGIL